MKIMANRPAPIRAAKPATIPALKLFMTHPPFADRRFSRLAMPVSRGCPHRTKGADNCVAQQKKSRLDQGGSSLWQG